MTDKTEIADKKEYIPLSERLQQDVWHDNFVPKYSALASAKPGKLFITGVWLTFVPMALVAIAVAIIQFKEAPDTVAAVVSSLLPLLFSLLAVAVLIAQTRQYLAAAAIFENDGDSDSFSTVPRG
jgi:hypothetical protein